MDGDQAQSEIKHEPFATLEAAEAALVAARRKAVSLDEKDLHVGLALSGGGIRSATFALGVLQGLAKLRLLRRIDYMSTVSGGGYAGGFLGALFSPERLQPQLTPLLQTENVRRELETQPGAETFAIHWLRENGHYLSPSRGSNLMLTAILLRNWISVLVTLYIAAITLFLWEDVVRAALPLLDRTALQVSNSVGYIAWCSPTWILPLACFVFALPLGAAYWLVPARPKGRLLPSWISLLIAWAGLGAVATLANVHAVAAERPIQYALGGFAGVLVVACVAWRFFHDDDPSMTRFRLTRALKTMLTTLLVLVAWAAIDTLAQTLYALTTTSPDLMREIGGWFAALLAPLAAIAAFGSKVLNFFHQQTGAKKQSKLVSVPLDLLALVLGVALAALLLVSAGVLGHALAWGGATPLGDPGKQVHDAVLRAEAKAAQPAAAPAAQRRAPVMAAVDGGKPPAPEQRELDLLWTLECAGLALVLSFLCSWTRPFLNHSSLSMFYSSRLTRTFLGASNPERRDAYRKRLSVPDAPTVGASVLQSVKRTFTKDQSAHEATMLDPTEVVIGDDIVLADYEPHKHGGPLHLINVTLNQTVGGDSSTQDRDRKGMAMAFGPAGVSVGKEHHATWSRKNKTALELHAIPPGTPVFPVPIATKNAAASGDAAPKPNAIEAESLPLGRLIAISGAAIAPGLGANTNLGASLLTLLLNLRLGYWWHSGVDVYRRHVGPRRLPDRIIRLFARSFPVLSHFLDEATAQFYGTARRQWYLSDGGHFENTACYELIRRRLPLIICCDAGADVGYGFADLANLVRLARIDFGADIQFLLREQYESSLHASVKPYFGELEELKRIDFRAERSDRTRQPHAAIARIRYAARASESKAPEGWLIVLKPTLCGDEPLDVRQYAEQNPEFPQQSTGDQSFDEAQWESYRRLGEHIAERVLAPAGEDGIETQFPLLADTTRVAQSIA